MMGLSLSKVMCTGLNALQAAGLELETDRPVHLSAIGQFIRKSDETKAMNFERSK